MKDDDLLSWDDVPTDELDDGINLFDDENAVGGYELDQTEGFKTVAEYRAFLLSKGEDIINLALRSLETNSTINALLGNLKSLNIEDDTLVINPELANKLEFESASHDIKTILESSFNGKVSIPQARIMLEQISFYFEAVSVDEIMTELKNLNNRGANF